MGESASSESKFGTLSMLTLSLSMIDDSCLSILALTVLTSLVWGVAIAV
jgi:hypothetical protein